MNSIIGENLPYTGKNPFTVEVSNGALLKIAALTLLLIVFASFTGVFVSKRFS
jgi:hypothetical protein